MRTTKTVLSAALAAGLIAALPGAANAGEAKAPARASGGDAPAVLPSIVRVRVSRGLKALDKADSYVDHDEPDLAVSSLLNARRNMYAAWRGATYVIEHAPPPVAGDGRVHRKAHSSGAAPIGSAYATPEQTAIAVLGLQHEVAATAYGLLDGAKGALRDSVSTTMFAALDRRDKAIEYIHDRPTPPVAGDGRAHKSDAPPGFPDMMPGIVPDLDDEIQQTSGLLEGGALTGGEKHIMNQAKVQVILTKETVNTFWPAPAGD